jgi:uncharacterized short protein YbdD (DUF466 family)
VNRVVAIWRRIWSGLRAVTGDDAYDRYLLHRRERHPGQPSLDRGSFYRAELERRWTQPNRCC